MVKTIVIGGGTGSFGVLTGLGRTDHFDLSAVVPSTDSGGSSGRLRDEFGFLPIGDVRQCLVALAEGQQESKLLRSLFSYRFDKGEDGLKGHNLGNLLLTALSDIVGSEVEAIRNIEKLFKIKGHVYPVSLEKCTLVAQYENGQEIEGEHLIDEPTYPHDGRLRITKLFTKPKGKINPEAKKAIANADLIILGPGDLYTSLIANLVISGMSQALVASKAKFIYIMNLVTKFGQTYNFTANDHLSEIVKYAGREPDYVLVNDNHLPADILKRYAAENAYPVVNDLSAGKRVIAQDFLAREEIVSSAGDVLRRSLIRHDGLKVAQVISQLV